MTVEQIGVWDPNEHRERVARARDLRERGMTYEQIAALLGLRRRYTEYLVREAENRVIVCAGCGKRMEWTHGKQKWCSETCRKSQYDLVCVDCGGRVDGTCPGRGTGERCQDCSRVHENRIRREGARLRTEEMVELRKQGWLNPDIAREMETTTAAVATILCRERKRGVDVPSSPYWRRAA